jgi:tetratricopeptide (TPR) repeat protein
MICELIDRDWGFEGILGLLDAYKHGASTEEAFESVLGIDLETFDERFFAYLDETFAVPLASLRPALESAEGHPPVAAGAPSRGARDLRRDAEENPDSFLAQLAYGAALAGEEDYDQAIRYFERAKQLFPGYAEANSPYWFLAMIARRQGDLQRAADELTALTEINEKHYEANVALAEVLEEMDQPAAAAEALERVIWIYPMEIALHERLASLYAETDNHPLRVRERRAVVALEPVDMAEALYELALAQVAAGDLAGAKRSVLGSLEIAPGYPAAQDLLLEIIGGGTTEEGR